MPESRSSVLHVVVGAGIIPHFRNAIESVLSTTDDLVFAVYNAISLQDSNLFSDFVENSGYGNRVVFRTLGNQGPSKTGSLYDAYNLAIDFASEENYDYINLVQADCQLMWWSDALVVRLDEIFAAAAISESRGVLCVGTVFPVLGKFAGLNLERNVVFDSELGAFVHLGAGLADVGIFSISAIRASGFNFVGTEASLQQKYSRDGYKVPLLDVPCTAFVPWPATVRNGKVVGTVIDPRLKGFPLLRLVDGATPEKTTASWGNSPIWMEDWVRPNGWDCLFPYWPTSLDNPKWVKRRLDACRRVGAKPWTTASRWFDGGSLSPARWPVVPGSMDMVFALASGYIRALSGAQRAIIRSVARRFRGLAS